MQAQREQATGANQLNNQTQQQKHVKKQFPITVRTASFLASVANLFALYVLTVHENAHRKITAKGIDPSLAWTFASIAAFNVFTEVGDHAPEALNMMDYIRENGIQDFLKHYDFSDDDGCCGPDCDEDHNKPVESRLNGQGEAFTSNNSSSKQCADKGCKDCTSAAEARDFSTPFAFVKKKTRQNNLQQSSLSPSNQEPLIPGGAEVDEENRGSTASALEISSEQEPETPSSPATQLARAIAVFATFGMLGLTLKATWGQSTLTSKSMIMWGGEGDQDPSAISVNALAIPFFVGLAGELVFISTPHLLMLILGKAEEFTQSATGHEAKTFDSIAVKILLFLTFCSLHLPQSALYATVDSNPIEYWSTTASFAILESVAHLNHAMVIKKACNTLMNRSAPAKVTTGVAGIFGGMQEASFPLLSLIHFKNELPLMVAFIACCAGIEFFLGFFEFQVHAGREVSTFTDRCVGLFTRASNPSVYTHITPAPASERESCLSWC